MLWRTHAGLVLALLGALFASASFALRGHALSEPQMLLGVLITLNIVCLAFWVGAFAPLARAARQDPPMQAGALAHEFGRCALWAVGLYGALVVEEATGSPEVDLDEVLLLDDWRLTDEAQIADGFGNMHDWAHGGRIGNWITANGDGGWSRDLQQRTRMLLRLVNTANARIFTLEARGCKCRSKNPQKWRSKIPHFLVSVISRMLRSVVPFSVGARAVLGRVAV